MVENFGVFPSEIRYVFEQLGSSFISRNVSFTLYPGSLSYFTVDQGVKEAGIITSLGNSFSSGSGNNQCLNYTYSVIIKVFPQGSGYTIPEGIQNFCQDQTLQLQAFPAKGYMFYMWNGSISEKINPITVTVNKSLIINALFIPSISMNIFPDKDGFAFSKNQTRVSDIVLYGAPEHVNLSVLTQLEGVKVSIVPSQLMTSLNGSVAKLYVSYDPRQYRGNISLTVVARGEKNQTASASYLIVQTPSEGMCCPSSSYNNFFPRLHYSARVGDSFIYFMNTLYAEPGTNRKYIQLSYKVMEYRGGWYYLDSTIASNCRSNTALDLYSQGERIFLVNLGLYGINFNLGTVSGLSLNWYYPPSAVGYCSTGIQVNGTKYVPYGWYTSNNQVISLTVDRNSNIYIAVDTFDTSLMQYHVEVLKTSLFSLIIGCPESKCRSISWENIFISQPMTYPAVPTIMHTSNKLVLVYQVLSSECNPDKVYVSEDSGNSWTYQGSFSASGYPLCNDLSSGTVQGDSIFFGGVNSAGELSWWSLNLTSSTYFSPKIPYLKNAESGAMISSGQEISLIYVSSGEVHIVFSYRPERFWVSDRIIAYGYQSVSLPSNPNSYQLIILCSDILNSQNGNGVSAYFSTV